METDPYTRRNTETIQIPIPGQQDIEITLDDINRVIGDLISIGEQVARLDYAYREQLAKHSYLYQKMGIQDRNLANALAVALNTQNLYATTPKDSGNPVFNVFCRRSRSPSEKRIIRIKKDAIVALYITLRFGVSLPPLSMQSREAYDYLHGISDSPPTAIEQLDEFVIGMIHNMFINTNKLQEYTQRIGKDNFNLINFAKACLGINHSKYHAYNQRTQNDSDNSTTDTPVIPSTNTSLGIQIVDEPLVYN